jgi:hypothetical protein
MPFDTYQEGEEVLVNNEMMDILELELVIGLIHEVKKKKITFKLTARR